MSNTLVLQNYIFKDGLSKLGIKNRGVGKCCLELGIKTQAEWSKGILIHQRDDAQMFVTTYILDITKMSREFVGVIDTIGWVVFVSSLA